LIPTERRNRRVTNEKTTTGGNMSEPTENYAIAGYLFDHDPGGAVKVYRANDPILADWKRSHDALGKLGGVKSFTVSLDKGRYYIRIFRMQSNGDYALDRTFNAPSLIEAIEKIE
jgi:hypothetical protein